MNSRESPDPTELRRKGIYKVAFDLPEGTARWARASVELLWAEKTSVKFEMEVRNTPFYVRGIAFADVVRVRADRERREFVFDGLVEESGHSTIRILLKDESVAGELDDLLRRSNCPWEIDSSGSLWAVDVPPGSDYLQIRRAFDSLKEPNRIEYEEGALSAAHRRQLESP